jgi:hypothetical protein
MDKERKRYIIFAMDARGVTHAIYEVVCESEEEAKQRAAQYLDAHEALELWVDSRKIGRLTRQVAGSSGQIAAQ